MWNTTQSNRLTELIDLLYHIKEKGEELDFLLIKSLADKLLSPIDEEEGSFTSFLIERSVETYNTISLLYQLHQTYKPIFMLKPKTTVEHYINTPLKTKTRLTKLQLDILLGPPKQVRYKGTTKLYWALHKKSSDEIIVVTVPPSPNGSIVKNIYYWNQLELDKSLLIYINSSTKSTEELLQSQLKKAIALIQQKIPVSKKPASLQNKINMADYIL